VHPGAVGGRTIPSASFARRFSIEGVDVRVCLFALLSALGSLANAATINGRVELYLDGKALRPEEAQDAIVYFRPRQAPTVEPATNPYVIGTRKKQFLPRVSAITVGSRVRFPNDDPILHNAFSTSKENAFDVGSYGQGEGQTITFSHVGYVRVYCNVHHSMVGHLLVLDTPYFAKPDASGAFHLNDVPEVPGDIVVWHERATPWHTVITPGQDPLSPVKLEVNQRKVPPHMNKFGKPYGKGNDGEY
jgi:plastocyanin